MINGNNPHKSLTNVCGFARASRVLVHDIGQIGAGKAVDFLPNSNKVWITRPFAARANDKLVRVQVCGNSLIDDEIRDGDFLICRSNFELGELHNGNLVVAKLPSGEFTIKRIFFKDVRTVTLRAANPRYPDQTFSLDEIEIHAIALELVRQL